MIVTEGVASWQEDVAMYLRRGTTVQRLHAHQRPILEHDFGSIQLGENTIFWKIDYYDLDLHMHSPDPSDETITARVLTIMLAEEY